MLQRTFDEETTSPILWVEFAWHSVVLRRECSLRVEQIEPVKRRSPCREGIGSLSRCGIFCQSVSIYSRSDRFGSSRYMYLNPIRPAAVKFVNSLDGTKARRLFNNCFARAVEQACRVSFCEKK